MRLSIKSAVIECIFTYARLRGFVCLATNLTIAEAAGRNTLMGRATRRDRNTTIAEAAGRNTRRLAFHQMKSEPIFHP